jgi:hypothetical protein
MCGVGFGGALILGVRMKVEPFEGWKRARFHVQGVDGILLVRMKVEPFEGWKLNLNTSTILLIARPNEGRTL